MVTGYLTAPSDAAFAAYRRAYLAELAVRFAQDRIPFEELADDARRGDVFLGCSCPTERNPDVRRCHTYLALEFMRDHYPDVPIQFP
jgi:hypothetical protein